MIRRGLVVAALLAVLPGAGRAFVASALGSTQPVESVSRTATGSGTGMTGEGWMVNGGWFFKDRLFNNAGRGGVHVDAGRAWTLAPWLGLWTGAGALEAHGSRQRFLAADGSRYDTTWNVRAQYVDAGVVIPWMPFPVALAAYRHASDVSDAAATGPLAGRTLAGSRDGIGLAIDIHIVFEWFVHADRKPPRGLGFTAGYIGFIDVTGHDLAATDAAGGRVTHPNWKPLQGESLRAGIEYEF